MGRAGLVPLFLRPASLEFHRPALVREQRRSCPAIVGLFGAEMPAQDRQLAGEATAAIWWPRFARTLTTKACSGPGVLAAAHAASTSMARAWLRPTLLMRP